MGLSAMCSSPRGLSYGAQGEVRRGALARERLAGSGRSELQKEGRESGGCLACIDAFSELGAWCREQRAGSGGTVGQGVGWQCKQNACGLPALIRVCGLVDGQAKWARSGRCTGGTQAVRTMATTWLQVSLQRRASLLCPPRRRRRLRLHIRHLPRRRLLLLHALLLRIGSRLHQAAQPEPPLRQGEEGSRAGTLASHDSDGQQSLSRGYQSAQHRSHSALLTACRCRDHHASK